MSQLRLAPWAASALSSTIRSFSYFKQLVEVASPSYNYRCSMDSTVTMVVKSQPAGDNLNNLYEVDGRIGTGRSGGKNKDCKQRQRLQRLRLKRTEKWDLAKRTDNEALWNSVSALAEEYRQIQFAPQGFSPLTLLLILVFLTSTILLSGVDIDLFLCRVDLRS